MSASRNGCAAAEGGRVAAGLRYGVEIRAAQPADGPEIARLLGLAEDRVLLAEQDGFDARCADIQADEHAAILLETDGGCQM